MARAGGGQDLLRFITCGSVDDGKSTLIGRLLYDTQGRSSTTSWRRWRRTARGSAPRARAIDFALLVDGLSAEREQGITIDVAYRYFATDKRRFIVADTPGHEQYTRNMVTGASTADLAVLLVDARKGVLTQTRRHSLLAKLVGIRRFVLAVTKMDLVDYDQARVRGDRRRLSRLRRARSGSSDWIGDPGVRPQRRQCRRAEARRCPGTTGRACSSISRRCRSTATADAGRAVPHAGAMGQPPEPGLPRLRRPDRQRHRPPRRRGARPAVRRTSTIARIVTAATAIWTKPLPASP